MSEPTASFLLDDATVGTRMAELLVQRGVATQAQVALAAEKRRAGALL